MGSGTAGHCRRGRFRGVVEEALGDRVRAAGPGRTVAGAAAQQPLTPGTVSGLDAHRRIDGKATAMRPLPHRLRVLGWRQAGRQTRATAAGDTLRLHLGIALRPPGKAQSVPRSRWRRSNAAPSASVARRSARPKRSSPPGCGRARHQRDRRSGEARAARAMAKTAAVAVLADDVAAVPGIGAAASAAGVSIAVLVEINVGANLLRRCAGRAGGGGRASRRRHARASRCAAFTRITVPRSTCARWRNGACRVRVAGRGAGGLG